jgi:4a-hydroxytetrahydrobiopterin dehydratase
MSKLSAEQISVYLRKLPKWKYDEDSGFLMKTFSCKSFRDAVHFVNCVAELAEAADHHPDMTIRSRKVTLTLTTVDNGGVTGKDFLLAQQIETLNY